LSRLVTVYNGDKDMDVGERRQAVRVPLLHKEIAVLHAADRDIPVKILNLSVRGLLMNFLDTPLSAKSAERAVELSLHDSRSRSMFQLQARVIRRTEQSVAVEFVKVRANILKRLEEKLRTVEVQNKASGKQNEGPA